MESRTTSWAGTSRHCVASQWQQPAAGISPSGVEAAFSLQVAPWLDLFQAGIGRILQGASDSQAVLQVALQHIRRGLAQDPAGRGGPAWAYGICIQEALSVRRSRSRHGPEHLQRVREGLAGLSEEHRAIFILRDLDGVSTEEAARLLGISQALVRQRLRGARLEMAPALGSR